LVRTRISELTLRWKKDAHSADLLIPVGKQLDEACELVLLETFSLNSEELSLIKASSARAKTRTALRRTAFGAVTLLTALAFGLGVSMVIAKRQAIERPVVVERLMSTILGDAVSRLGPDANLKLSDDTRAEVLKYFISTNEQDLSPSAIAQRPKTLMALADLAAQKGDKDSARIAWEAAGAIMLKQLIQRPNDPGILRTMRTISFRLGDLHSRDADTTSASDFFKKSQAYTAKLIKLNPKDASLSQLQSEEHRALGILAARNLDYIVAVREYKSAIELKTRALAAEPQNIRLMTELAKALAQLGPVQKALGEFPAAMEIHQKETQLARNINQVTPKDDEFIYRWAVAIHEQAEISLALGNDRAALNFLKQAEQLYVGIVEHDPGQIGWLSALTNTRILIQDILARGGAMKTQLTNLNKISADLQKTGKINRGTPLLTKQIWERLNAQLKTIIVVIMTEMSSGKTPNEALIKAGNELIEAEQTLSQQLKENPDKLTSMLLADALLARAALERKTQTDTLVKQTCQRGHDVLAKEIPGSVDFELLVRWIQLNVCLGASEEVARTKQILTKIGYRDTRYLRLITLAK
jgi:tetratricopeptide (TPR) repeat protein